VPYNDRMTRILCLDDEPEIIDLLSLILKRKGYEVIGTTDGRAALEVLRHQPIDLFTQDFARPDFNGLELLQIVKSDAALRDIPVVGISARPRDARTEEMKQVGLDLERDLGSYIVKPFSPYDLLEAIETVLTQRGKAIPPRATQLRDSRPDEG
jgi:CheY-like chemotaxis protein